MSTIGRTLVALVIGMGLAWRAADGQAADAGPPAVVATIPPLHSLVSAVMAGVGEPRLLIKGAASPHTASLRPSDAAALQGADLVFWIGDGLEAFLVKPLAALPEKAEVVALAEAPGVRLLPAREGGAWGEHHHADAHEDHAHEDHAHEDHEHGHEPGEAAAEEHGGEGNGEGAVDMHIWLDPENAKAMAAAIAGALAKADPARAGIYAGNVQALQQRLTALDEEIRAELAPVAGKPYIVFHDAYQYFEARYGLSPAGAITFSPERAPGAKTLSEVRDRIKTSGAVCVFREPQFEPDLVKTVIGGSFARVGVLDPIGADIPPGPDAYPALLDRLATAVRDCFDA